MTPEIPTLSLYPAPRLILRPGKSMVPQENQCTLPRRDIWDHGLPTFHVKWVRCSSDTFCNRRFH